MRFPLSFTERESKQEPETLFRRLFTSLRQFSQNVGFGDGTNSDNIHGVWVTYTTNAAADTEDAITHNTGEVPIGYLVFSRNKAGVVYDSGTAWTVSKIFLKCNVASVTVKIFILLQSNAPLGQ